MNGEVISTDRLELSPLRATDAEEMVEVLADEGLYSFTGGSPPTLEEVRARFHRLEAGSPDPAEVWLNWIIRRTSDGRAAGYVQATVTPESTELAWLLGLQFQGEGIAGEAAQGLKTWLDQQGVSVMKAHIHPENRASQRVAERIGLRDTNVFDEDGEQIWATS